jgi:hypothetical protein
MPGSHACRQQPEGLQDIRIIFPPALKRTPSQVAVNHVIAVQAREEANKAVRVQTLKEKFEASAHLKLSNNKGITWSLQTESKDVADSVRNKDADMEDSNCARPVSDMDQGTPAVNQGSRHRHATKVARLFKHLKEQERIAASNKAIADALEDLESTVHEAPDAMVPTPPTPGLVSTAPLTTPEHDAGSTRGSFITDLTAVHWDTRNRGSASLSSNATPSLATMDSLSGISSVTNSAACPAGLAVAAPLLRGSRKFLLPPSWGRQFINKLHNIVHKQWIYRNSFIHYPGADGLTLPEHHDILNRIEEHIYSDPESLLPRYRYLLEADYASLGSGSTTSQLLWLANVKSAMAASTLARVRTLTSDAVAYFTRFSEA